jgi:hypothetical protein
MPRIAPSGPRHHRCWARLLFLFYSNSIRRRGDGDDACRFTEHIRVIREIRGQQFPPPDKIRVIREIRGQQFAVSAPA